MTAIVLRGLAIIAFGLVVAAHEARGWLWPRLKVGLRQLARVPGWLWRGWIGLGAASRLRVLAAMAVACLGLWAWSARETARHWYEAEIAGSRPLNKAQSWYYNLSNIDIDHIATSTADLLVIDYAKGDGMVPLTPAEVARIKKKPDGTSRLAVSYISMGEAENYRFYWRKDWADDDMPGWHVMENCAWPQNHKIRFWHDGWRDIIYRGRKSYIKRIIDAGFDGVYLDRVDIFWEMQKERETAREDMIAFVKELAAAARALKPGFITIAQNAEHLLDDKSYRDVIDGLGKEDLLYGHSSTGGRNTPREIAESVNLLKLLRADWKPVFAVEYLPTQALIDSAKVELERLGLVPTFAHRSLDGKSPLITRPPDAMPYGTPEWIAEKCKDKPHW